MTRVELDDLKGVVSSLLAEIYYYDNAKNEMAIQRRKDVHIKLIESKASYSEAYKIMRELIDGPSFYPVMSRIRETCLAVVEGHETVALKMVDEYYARHHGIL